MSEQEEAWKGYFGTDYAKRSPGNVDANIHFFRKIFKGKDSLHVESIIEFGCGVGRNLAALKKVAPHFQLHGVEINEEAARQAEAHGTIVCGSMLGIQYLKCDLSFTKGVLIHIPPADLTSAYRVLYNASLRYILVAEYYAPKITEIEYRGRMGLLWKRDFAGEMLDAYPDLRLIGYGFVYHRDAHPQDDLTWFLMEKR